MIQCQLLCYDLFIPFRIVIPKTTTTAAFNYVVRTTKGHVDGLCSSLYSIIWGRQFFRKLVETFNSPLARGCPRAKSVFSLHTHTNRWGVGVG